MCLGRAEGEEMTTIPKLKEWLKDNIEYEDYCIEHNLSHAAHVQKMCWYSVLEKLGEEE